MAWNNKRPLSPHLQIYKLPLTAIVSITHRATGIALATGCIILVWVLSRAAGGAENFELAQTILSSWFGYLVLIGFTFALYLHFCNGIRHLFWDVGVGFELEFVNKSTKAVIAAAVVLTMLTWLVAIAAG